MPANKNAFTRYQILDELLSSRYRNYSLEDLTEEVNRRIADLYPDCKGVVRRTIEKDLKYLEHESAFMVDIERYTIAAENRKTGKNYNKLCLRYAEKGFSIFKKELSAEEKNILRELLTILGKIDGLPEFEGLDNLRTSLGVVNDRTPIISMSKNPIRESRILGELFAVITQNVTIKLRYHKFGEQVVREVGLYPYLLKEYNGRWYLLGGSVTDQKLLIFALDRMEGFVPMPEKRFVPFEGDMAERFEDIVGVSLPDHGNVEKIVFWVSDKSADYVITKPIHESQRSIGTDANLRSQYPTLCGGRFFIIECIPNYELIRELTSFGANLIVLTPTSIRDEVCRRIEAMHNAYSSLRTKSSQGGGNFAP